MPQISQLRYILPGGATVSFDNWTQEPKFGVKWACDGREYLLDFGYEVDAYPTPTLDGIIIVYPDFHKAPLTHPDNAAIYNADGSLRFRLKAPKPLSSHWPGYVHTPEQIKKRPPEGFWQVGWGCGDGITDFSRPWMWANIGLHCDVYERRYFDPKTGEFDLEHYSTARR